ncbi:Hypothetical predicted protein, partial [Paramuricea clavata]
PESSTSTEYLERSQQSDRSQEQSDSQGIVTLIAPGELPGRLQNPQDVKNIEEVSSYRQTSDTTTITLSWPSQKIAWTVKTFVRLVEKCCRERVPNNGWCFSLGRR